MNKSLESILWEACAPKNARKRKSLCVCEFYSRPSGAMGMSYVCRAGGDFERCGGFVCERPPEPPDERICEHLWAGACQCEDARDEALREAREAVEEAFENR